MSAPVTKRHRERALCIHWDISDYREVHNGADHAQIIAWLKAEVPRRRARGEPQIAAVEAQQSASKEGERAEGYLAALTELESRVCDDRGCNCWQMVLKNMRAEHDGSEAF